MHYLHAPREDHRDLASGAVLHSRPGQPAFPVRLARELFARARLHRPTPEPATVWDPCCGSAQLLVTLGLTERLHLRRLVGSDVDDEALALATRNARLTTSDGLRARHAELHADAAEHGRPAHEQAAEAALRLETALELGGGDLPTEIRRADALDPTDAGRVAADTSPDIVIADLPHDRLSSWVHTENGLEPETRLVRTLAQVLPDDVVVVLVARSRRPPLPRGTRALERLRAGHRSAGITYARWLADGVAPCR